jgi:uncharacterized protein (TIGR01777 family)
MKVTITGGTGLIGSALLHHLSPEDFDITVLSRSKEGESKNFPHVEYTHWDVNSSGPWIDKIGQSDAVINLAGENIAGKSFFPSRWTPEKKQRIIDSRVQSGEAVVRAINQSPTKPQLLIQASAIGYYPFQSDNKIQTERSPSGTDFLSEVSLAWENSTSGVESLGVRRAVIRIGIVLSSDSGALPRLLLPHKLFVGGPFGAGNQWYSWIHISDICNAIKFILSSGANSSIYNLTAPNPVSNKDFSKILGRILSRPSWLPLPGFVMRSMFGEVSDVVLKGQRVIPENLQESGYSFLFPDLQSALVDLVEK